MFWLKIPVLFLQTQLENFPDNILPKYLVLLPQRKLRNALMVAQTSWFCRLRREATVI